jgi:hypothetical protein
MRRIRRLPIPQHEFCFVRDTFNLIAATGLDGDRISREQAEADRARRAAESAQTRLFASQKIQMKTSYPFRLRAGDVIRLAGESCRVIRVSECSAVVAVTKQPREFTTLFGVRVRIQPKPGLVRISPQSEVPILNR